MKTICLATLSFICVLGCGSSDSDSDTDAGSRKDSNPPPELWDWCPDANSAIVDASWSDTIVVPDRIYCSSPGRAGLAAIMSNKRRYRYVPGEYPFPPRTEGTGDYLIPFCIETVDGQGPAQSGTGTYRVLPDAQNYILGATFDANAGNPVGLTNFSLTNPTTDWPDLRDELFFGTPCDYFGADTTHRSSATFAGGDNIVFEYAAEGGKLGTGRPEPSGNFKVTGSIGGTAIDIDDYYRIAYNPSHHHSAGDSEYAVVFDSEINGACGLRLSGGTGDPQVPTAALVDCDLNDIQALTITESSIEENLL